MRLGLEEVYSGHTDVVAKIVTKAQAYNESFYQSLVDTYSGLGKTPAKIYRLIWRTCSPEYAHSTKCKSLIFSLERLKNGVNPFTFVTCDKNGPYPFTCLTSFSYLCVKESNSKTHCYGR